VGGDECFLWLITAGSHCRCRCWRSPLPTPPHPQYPPTPAAAAAGDPPSSLLTPPHPSTPHPPTHQPTKPPIPPHRVLPHVVQVDRLPVHVLPRAPHPQRELVGGGEEAPRGGDTDGPQGAPGAHAAAEGGPRGELEAQQLAGAELVGEGEVGGVDGSAEDLLVFGWGWGLRMGDGLGSGVGLGL